MIAHSGFTRNFSDQVARDIAALKAKAKQHGHVPCSLEDWMKSAPHGETWTKYPFAPPVPAPAVRPDVPMAMHLEHLEITAQAARNFWFVIGWCCGSAAGALLATYLYHRYG